MVINPLRFLQLKRLVPKLKSAFDKNDSAIKKGSKFELGDWINEIPEKIRTFTNEKADGDIDMLSITFCREKIMSEHTLFPPIPLIIPFTKDQIYHIFPIINAKALASFMETLGHCKSR